MKLKDRFKAFLGKDIDNDVLQKSAGLSPFVQSQLGGYNQYGFWLSPSLAYWMWEKSDTVGDCCERIAMAFQEIQPALRNIKTGEYLTKSTDHPFLDLLEHPGYMMDSGQLFSTMMVAFLVTGNCFPILSGNVNYEPIALSTVSANKANLIADGNNQLYSINFTDHSDMNIYNRQLIPKRRTAVYQDDNQLSETIQILMNKRRFGVESQSVLDRIYHQTMTKYYGNIHNSGLMKNGSRPSGMWSPEKESFSQIQYESFKTEIAEKMSGPLNAGKNVVSPRAVKYENFLLNPRDMDFVKLIEQNRTEIYNSYQIPLALVSQSVMTMSNFENSMVAFFDNAVLPRARFILKRLGEFALPRYKDGDRFELTYDEKTLPALKARMFDRAKKMREVGSFTEDEIRNTTGYENKPAGEDGTDVYKPAMLVNSTNPEEEFDETELDDPIIED